MWQGHGLLAFTLSLLARMNVSNISIKAVTGKLDLYFNTNLTLRKYPFTPPPLYFRDAGGLSGRGRGYL